VFTTQALIQGNFETGAISHALTIGASTQSRRDRFADAEGIVYDFVGHGNMYNPEVDIDGNILSGSSRTSGPVGLRRRDTERSIFVHDIIGLNDHWKVHAGLRYVETERDQFNVNSLTGVPITSRYEKDHVLPSMALVFTP